MIALSESQRGAAVELLLLLLLLVIVYLLPHFSPLTPPQAALLLSLYPAWHLWQLQRLLHWLAQPTRPLPSRARVGLWWLLWQRLREQQRDHRRQRRRLAQHLNRFREATAAVPDATLVLSAENEILWFNDAATELLHLDPSSDVGVALTERLDSATLMQLLRRDEAASLLIPSPCDESVTLSVRAIPYARHQRLLILRDVSEQQRLEQVRRDFVANVSHELRTPLTVVSGFVEMLLEEESAACRNGWERSLQLMAQQSQRMRRIVEDLLLLSRLETDRSAPPLERVAVTPLLETLRDDAEQLGRDKDQQIRLESDASLQLLGSRHELMSVFTNLISNAVRYTPEGGQITIRWYRHGDEGCYEVEDTGIGIERRHLPRLTERFYRVDVGRSRDSGGTGLGLAIVKHVLSRHDARLGIESTPGKGSRFCCRFPATRLIEAVNR